MKITIEQYNGPATDGKITAIKSMREVTGLGLKESKEIVDNIWAGSPTDMNINKDQIPKLVEKGFIIESNQDLFQSGINILVSLLNEKKFKAATQMMNVLTKL